MTAMRARMRKEIEMLEADPPYGVSAWPKDNQLDKLEAQILGPEGSPYEKGTFVLEIEIPERYPFEPPKVKFLTPIFHPNIDDGGRICLDTLKMQPKGSWMPSVNISTLLTTIRLLMAEPNADDGLMPDITDLFKHNRELFTRKATEHTRQHACESSDKTASQHVVAAATSTTSAPTEAKKKSSVMKPSENTEKTLEASHGGNKTVGATRTVDERDSFSDGDDSSDESDFSDEEDDRAKRQRTR